MCYALFYVLGSNEQNKNPILPELAIQVRETSKPRSGLMSGGDIFLTSRRRAYFRQSGQTAI